MAKGKDIVGLAKDKHAVMVDLKFMDFLGLWQHFTIPIAELSEGVFEEGLGFDGSSIRGWVPIHASDMLVMPDPDTAMMDPFMKDPTLSLICNVVDPITKEPYARDPRFIAQKAERYLKQSGIGDTAFYGPEAEFFIFDGISYDSGPNHAHYKIESREGQWETGSAVEHSYDGKQHGTRPNLGYKPRYKEGLLPGRAHRLAAGHPHRDVPGDGAVRHQGGAAAPRGGHRGTGGDRHPLRLAGEDRRQADVVQVHHQERRAAQRQDRDLHAQAALRRQRQRHAHAPVASGRTASRSSPAKATPA